MKPHHHEQSALLATPATASVQQRQEKVDDATATCLETPTSRWVKNDYELVCWPPDVERDKAAGIHVAGEEQEDDTPDAAQVSLRLT